MSSGLALLQQLRKDQLKLEDEADRKNQRRRRIFKSWFRTNLWRRYVTHTTGMDIQPSIVNWLPTKKLDDTYRGSDKDDNTSAKGNRKYTAAVRLRWSAVVFRTALYIVAESGSLKAMLLDGQPLDLYLISSLVRHLINEALEDMIALREPESRYGLVCNIKHPPGLLATASLEQLEKANVTITFVHVNRHN